MDMPDDPANWSLPGPADSFADAQSPETEFLQTQLAVIEAYLQRFPGEQRDLRALAWIEAHAGDYRQQWQAQAASRRGRGPSARAC
ncbi:MAG: hypothetical protein FAZ92_04028 [Accumulibacter sp.]|jgi:hypothetical protein|uniref:hypothetical protein n=1 Tax=Accumulibacter sp. TaxID=2053492 RepID=UPI0012275F65|nr:hypothetical protein [Accumulibacter sp.]QKS29374.1 MAG: hypothetical protein HT579_10930 [Candidatus Accumulibacter similis]TLD43709.1 MAG: hypothetical protein FAZ92_04028 [Accumulibacter sp.]